MLAQLLREHPGVKDAEPDHEAGLAAALDPIPEASAFYVHDARIALCHELCGHECLRTSAALEKARSVHKSIIRCTSMSRVGSGGDPLVSGNRFAPSLSWRRADSGCSLSW